MSEHEAAEGLTRRQFVARSAAGAALALVGCAGGSGRAGVATAADPQPAGSGPAGLEPLPYPDDGLEPHVSARTIGFHYGKHHAGYVSKVGEAVASTDLEGAPLEDIVRATVDDPARVALFNSAAQAWNHAFYWNSMRPSGGGRPEGRLAELVDAAFGGYDGFREAFASAASTQFGSGWAWLVLDGADLAVVQTANAATPLTSGKTPLLTIDVWEHAYYLDYQNRRKDYITAWLDHLVNWDFAANNLP